MPTLRRLVFLFAFAFFIGALIDFSARLFAPTATLVCVEPTCNVGRLRESEAVEHSFVIKNTGAKACSLLSVHPSCSACVDVVSFTAMPIAPGSEGVVNVRFDPAGLTGVVKRQILVKTDDPGNAIMILVIVAAIEESMHSNHVRTLKKS